MLSLACIGNALCGGSTNTGTVYKITSGGTFSTLHGFTGRTDGLQPAGPVLLAKDGNFYGLTSFGGANGGGTVFKLTQAGALTTLHAFSVVDANEENADGRFPQSGLIQGTDGNFYGTTASGGAGATGTVFKLTPAGVLTTLHSFSFVSGSVPNSDGAAPAANLVQGKDGNFYGTAAFGGTGASGTMFRMTPTGAFWVLHSFAAVAASDNNSEGARPFAPLIQSTDGKFYGSALQGGTSGNGAVFQATIITAAPTVTSATTATGQVGVAFTYRIAATDSPASYGASGLPAGLTINQTTGKISGTPTKAGTYSVMIAAFNAVGAGTAKLTLVIKPAA